MQHGALLEETTVLMHGFQRGIHLRQRYFCQEAQRAKIHAQNRYVRFGQRPRCRQQRAVSTQHNGERRLALRRIFALHRIESRHLRRGLLVHDDGVSLRLQPLAQANDHGRQLHRPWLGENGNEFFWFGHHRWRAKTACNRNSRLPSAPKIGESVTSISFPPSPSTAR